MIRILTIIVGSALFAGGFATGQNKEDWKLLPLKYNNPGLVVDLGVGLWAWPLPMDYDGDGDLDLLVSCPDKPSRGVYFFENPSQDAAEKFPVFKPGVRLGTTNHNMQVSYVNGEPRILLENMELTDFKNGDFDKKKKIYPAARFHKGQTRARMWRYIDYEGDGDQDLVVGIGDWTDYVWDHAYDARGKWRNGPLHGYVYLIENEGSDESPEYSKTPRRIQAGGADIDVYGWPSPSFADFDGDGDLDLICGEFLDGFTYFENIGSREKPEYGTGEKIMASDGKPLVMDLQMITPTAIDWDGDNDYDLIVGDEDGRVALVENVSQRGAPEFAQPVYFQQEADTLKFGALSTPFAYDWDGDGDEDILCGNTAGYIGYFENIGNNAWNAPQLLEVDGKPFRILAGPNGSIQGPCEAKWGYTTLSVGDWNGNHAPDVVVNSILGDIVVLERTEDGQLAERGSYFRDWEKGDVSRPKWDWRSVSTFPHLDRLRSELRTQWRTTPVLANINDDALPDLVHLDDEGFISVSFTEKKGDNYLYHASERRFVDEDLEPVQLNNRSAGRSGRYKLSVVDWDGDGRLDILTNSENATWWRNCKDAGDGKVILKKIGNLAKRNVAGHTSSPAVCDFDKNGKPDLLVGAENGRIYYIKHEDCITYSGEKIMPRPPRKIPAPRFPGLVSEGMIYNKAPFKQCHASTICETSRGLVAAWFGGTREKNPDVGIWYSYHDGSGWSGIKEAANGIQYEGHRHPCWNPVLYQPPGDAPTLLFFKVGPNPAEWWGEMMVSYDRGRSFRDRCRLPEGIDGPVRCKPILLPDGKTLLSGSSTEYDGWRVHFEKIKLENGMPAGHWKRIGPINTGEEFGAIQPTFLQHADGKLQVLCRSKQGVITTSFSSDQGETWSKMEATNLPNPNSGIEAVTLTDGRHLLIYNHLDSGGKEWGRRGLLNLAISKDGKNWNKVAMLEQQKRGEFSYPAIIQTKDGLVHMTYTYKRELVKHVVIDPKKITTGEALSLEPW